MVSTRGSYYPDHTLAPCGIDLDDELNHAVRDSDDGPLSVLEYIDGRIEIAVRSATDEFQELYACRSDAEIKNNGAEKKYDKGKATEGKRAFDKEKLAEDKQGGIVEQLEYWEAATPSRRGPPEGSSPKKRPRVK